MFHRRYAGPIAEIWDRAIRTGMFENISEHYSKIFINMNTNCIYIFLF